MLNNVRRIFSKNNNYLIISSITDEYLLKYSKKQDIECYFGKKPKKIYLLLEKTEGLYKISYTQEDKKVEITLAERNDFINKGKYIFYPCIEENLSEEIIYYKNNLVTTIQNTKEIRLKLLLN